MKSYRFQVSCAFVMIALGAGCSASSGTSSTPASNGDVASYRQLALSVQAEATSYRSSMQGTGVTTATCQNLHDQYDQSVRPWVSQMLQRDGSMDDLMASHSGSAVADYECVAVTMMDELDFHRSMACSSPDSATNRLEANRHGDAMALYTGHVQDRCDQVMGALEHGDESWGPMMQGCQAWDGHCSPMMHNECCAGMMHDHCQASQ